MNIGGSALPNGIILQYDDIVVKSTRNKNEEIVVEVKSIECQKKYIKNKYERIIERMPVLRGIYHLIIVNGNKYIKLNILLFLLLDIFERIPLLNNDSVSSIYSSLLVIINVFLIGAFIYILIYLKSILKYHGVEHKIVNAFEQDKRIQINEVKKCSRVHNRCGTIFAIFVLLTFIAIKYFVSILSLKLFLSIQVLLSIGIAYEIYSNEFLNKIGFKHISTIGGYIQKYLTTLEPDEKQLEVGIACINKLLEVSKGLK